MGDIESSAQGLTHWWSQLDFSKEWDSMPRKMREDLLGTLQNALVELEHLNISKRELLDLITLTDPPTVWDAILSLERMQKENKSRWEILAYLKATAINMWKQNHPTLLPTKQLKPVKEKPIKTASWKTVEKWRPFNFSKVRCPQCGAPMRSDNTVGVCASCQKDEK